MPNFAPLSRPLPDGLPDVDDASAAHSDKVAEHLRDCIANSAEGMIPFDRWMDQALYAPGLGYYAAGSVKLGIDFTTAPELTPIFGWTLANQVADILHACQGPHRILEFGAGTGALAESLLEGLAHHDMAPEYLILEVSPDLRARQHARLARFGEQVQWLETLPERFRGCVVANEVLDAMPVKLFRFAPTLQECMVGLNAQGQFTWRSQPAHGSLAATVGARMPSLPGYQSEVNLQAEAWVRELGTWLEQGAALLIDYGFPRHEYYHPQRSQGSLMCHFRHHSHADPLVLVGLQDITAHVDFTAMADAALDGGLDVMGYTSQAHFLINSGILDILSMRETSPEGLSAVQKLLSEAEMGELFKVLVAGKNLPISYPLRGFSRHDRRHRL